MTTSNSWGTPTARQDSKSPARALEAKQEFGRELLTTLRTQALSWATPTVMGNHSVKGPKAGDGLMTMARDWPTLDLGSVASRHLPTMPTDGETGSSAVDLNPCFVAALMGVPWNWLMPSTSVGTAPFRQWFEQHSTRSSSVPKRSRARPDPSQPSLFAMQAES